MNVDKDVDGDGDEDMHEGLDDDVDLEQHPSLHAYLHLHLHPHLSLISIHPTYCHLQIFLVYHPFLAKPLGKPLHIFSRGSMC